MTPTYRLLLSGVALSALSACGLTGDLQRPDPLLGGDRPASDIEAAEPVANNIEDPLEDPIFNDPEDELLGGPGGL